MWEKLYYNNVIYIFKYNTITVKHCHIKYTYHYQAINNKSLNLKVIFNYFGQYAKSIVTITILIIN